MAKKVVCIYDRGIDKAAMSGFCQLEEYGYEVELIEKTVGETPLEYQNSMLEVEVNGPDKTPINPEAYQAVADAEIIITHFAPVGKKLMDAAPNLKIIGTLRTGVENINLEEAEKRDIKVINAPGRAAAAVADFTVAAMVCEMRNIARTDADIKKGLWTKKFENMAYSDNMCNMKVGLIGFGDIGKRIAKRLQAFGTTIMVYDPYCKKEDIEALGCAAGSMEEVVSECDFVSLHMRLTPETKGMFGKHWIEKMKPTAIFVNTARAGLVDEQALIDALRNKRIGGAVLDVFQEEPLSEDHVLRKLDNVTLSAHLAGTSIGTFTASVDIVADSLRDYLSGKPLRNIVA